MTKAIFPGSFDPVTNGHLETIKKAARLFEKVYVVVMTNTKKKYLFSSQDRWNFIFDEVKDWPNVEVLIRDEDLTVSVARKLGARVIVRGLRNSKDFIYEQEMASLNSKLAPEIETVFLLTSAENSVIASSMVKEVAQFGGDVSAFLPKKASQALKKVMQDGKRKN
ncbi:pantetheine-phosphate adenylyltransferase [Lactobacillus psittaci]|uniref:Phosphopantetheine adenylyltransferase n=1 Tax=Lactobacillus psittaci DSM 15354 TaxID=1122152 RepID=A0A0R1S4D8_9LACO|nr:pantetheine-phosphate adenylyltransferase [Lactobacillus psittaci]KRL63497.1 phosphopantetheine adenylyltransferase [Lactobacillus psittaci DSM 15354]